VAIDGAKAGRRVKRARRIAAAAVLVTVGAFGVQLLATGGRIDEQVFPVVPTPSEPTLGLEPTPSPTSPTTSPKISAPTTAPEPTAPTARRHPRSPSGTAPSEAPRSQTGTGIQPLIRDGAPAPSNGPDGPPAVVAAAETELFPDISGDEADDSAVFRNAGRPERSLVLADNKAESGGVAVYNMSGKLIHYERGGKIGNIDLRSGIPMGNGRITLVGANDRSNDTMRFWSLDPARGRLTSLDARPLKTVSPNYGFCLGRSADGARTYAFVSGEQSGTFEQYELRLGTASIDAVKVRTLNVGSLSEGCVVDDVRGALYIAEEDVGIWRYSLAPTAGSARISIDSVGGGNLAADVEGLAAARGADGRGVLVASSQGNSTYSVYDLDGRHAFRGSFRVRNGPTVDGTSATDGLALGSGSFGPTYPDGLLVVHDADNSSPSGGSERGSNLKFARFDQVFALAR
jgi:3-phytase